MVYNKNTMAAGDKQHHTTKGKNKKQWKIKIKIKFFSYAVQSPLLWVRFYLLLLLQLLLRSEGRTSLRQQRRRGVRASDVAELIDHAAYGSGNMPGAVCGAMGVALLRRHHESGWKASNNFTRNWFDWWIGLHKWRKRGGDRNNMLMITHNDIKTQLDTLSSEWKFFIAAWTVEHHGTPKKGPQ